MYQLDFMGLGYTSAPLCHTIEQCVVLDSTQLVLVYGVGFHTDGAALCSVLCSVVVLYCTQHAHALPKCFSAVVLHFACSATQDRLLKNLYEALLLELSCQPVG